MANKEEIEREIEVVMGLHALLTTNEELAVARMQHIRRSVLKQRKFMDEMIDLFREVRGSQAEYLQALYRQRKKNWLLRAATKISRRNGDGSIGARAAKRAGAQTGSAAVLLSANDRLSGHISEEVFTKFISFVREHKAHPIILGRVGKSMYEEAEVSTTADFFLLPDDRDITLADIRPLVKRLAEYNDIRIFYARFINLVKQVVNSSQLGESPLQHLQKEGTSNGRTVTTYLYEPSFERVVEIFDTQILTALLTQVATEAQLGLLGSRVTNLERAQQLVESYLADLEKLRIRNSRRETSQEQRERLAGMALWH